MKPDSPEFENLLAAVCHGTATDAQYSELAEILADREDAQIAYLRYVDLHATLASDDALFAGDDLESGSASGSNASGIRLPGSLDTSPPIRLNPSSQESKGTRMLLVTLIAALILSAFLLATLVRPDPMDSTEASTENHLPSFALASVTRSHQAVWEGVTPPLDIADPQPLLLQSGLVQIEFNCGAIVLAEAPLEGEILSASALRIDHGKIRVIVPAQSNGFTLYTDTVKVSGTECEFGVSLDGIDRGEVHAFEGPVDFIPSGKAGRRILQGGEAVTFFTGASASQRPAMRPANPSGFVGLQELDEQARSASEDQHQRWMDYCRQIQTDPDLLVHFTFENFNPWDRVVSNTAPSTGKMSDGAMIGCRWTRGRWPEKGAVEFHRPSHRVRLNVKNDTGAFSLLAWVNVSEGATQKNQVIYSCTAPATDKARTPEWGIGKDGNLYLSLRGKGKAGTFVIRSGTPLGAEHAGRWMHLAVTADGEAATFYVDGEAFPATHSNVGQPSFQFRRSELGNRALPSARRGGKEKDKGKLREKDKQRVASAPFTGLIDEFQIYGRALSPPEIRSAREAGDPSF